jgi:hypothetical protein
VSCGNVQITRSARLHHIVWFCVLLLYSHFPLSKTRKAKNKIKPSNGHTFICIYLFLERENSAAFMVYDKKESHCDGDDIF